VEVVNFALPGIEHIFIILLNKLIALFPVFVGFGTWNRKASNLPIMW